MEYLMNLQLLAEGAADSADGSNGAVAEPTGENEAETPAAEEPVDLDAEFEALIKGKYRDQYGKRVADTVNKRVRSLKASSDKYEALQPTVDTLYARYGVNTPEDLDRAVKADRAFVEAKAYELGMTPEAFEAQINKDYMLNKVSHERDALKQQIEDAEADRILQGWRDDAVKLKKYYPQIDFDAEMKDPTFKAALGATGNVKSAYEIAHWGEIGPQMMQYASKEGEKKVAADVAANGRRPVEGGAAPQGTGSAKLSAKDTTLAQREEIERLVQSGVRYTF